MSFWTHASVKFWVKGELNIGEIQRLVGYASDYYDSGVLRPWDNEDKFLPIGSEGTLNIYVHKNNVFGAGCAGAILKNHHPVDSINQ